jgi:hydrogenase maturation protease
MSRWLVLGLGNSLSGADGFGAAVIDRLRDQPSPRATIVDAGTDLLDWVDRFADYDRVVLVDVVAVDDAMASGSEAGQVAVIDEPAFSDWDARSPGAHELSPLAAVRLFRTLQARSGGDTERPEMQLVGWMVGERQFSRRPHEAVIADGAAAVRRLMNAPSASA